MFLQGLALESDPGGLETDFEGLSLEMYLGVLPVCLTVRYILCREG